MGVSKRKVLVITGSAAVVATPMVAGGSAQAASFNVDNLGDSGPGTLRQAILDANAAAGPDVITFEAGLTGTIVLTSGQIDITDSVTIDGPGATVVTVSGNDNSRIFYLYNSAATPNDIVISGLTLTDGSVSDEGGAVASWGDNLTLDGVVITDSEAYYGGGLAFDAYYDPSTNSFVGTLRITDSEISGNTASDTGGGIFIDDTGGDVVIEDVDVLYNQAYYYGGGLAVVDTNHDITIEGSSFIGNGVDAEYGATGGGLWFYDSNDSTVTLIRSEVMGNYAYDEGGGIAFGLSGEGTPDGNLVIDSSTIADNRADDDDGGGLLIAGGEEIEIVNSTVSGNTAGDDGGGIYLDDIDGILTVRHSTIFDNYADDDGGGIYLYDAVATIDHSIVSGNDSDSGDRDIHLYYSEFSAYWSILGDTPAPVAGSDNIYDTDPVLGPLQDNGGPTETHLPLALSPALEAGDPAIVDPPEFDQRGVARVTGVIEIGSVEVVSGPQDDEYSTSEDTVLNVAAPGVLGNDEPGSTTATLVTAPTNGTLVLNPDGSFMYTPDANFNGADSFEYSVLPGQQQGSLDQAPLTATVTLTITPVNDPPVALNDAVAALAGVGQSVTVKVNDTDPDGDTITIVGVTQGSKGTVVIEGNTVRYTANPGTSGADSFTYTISDGFETATATVNVTITGGRIPDTGSSSWSLVFLAGGLLGAGAVLTGTSRRRRPIG